MHDGDLTLEELSTFYSRPENQIPQGPGRRRSQRMSDPVPVRLPPETLKQVKVLAHAENRSVASFIRQAVQRALSPEQPRDVSR